MFSGDQDAGQDEQLYLVLLGKLCSCLHGDLFHQSLPKMVEFLMSVHVLVLSVTLAYGTCCDVVTVFLLSRAVSNYTRTRFDMQNVPLHIFTVSIVCSYFLL